MMKSRSYLFTAMLVAPLALMASKDYSFNTPKVTDVKVTGGFWLSRIETNRLATLKTDFEKCNETPRINNFKNAAARKWGTFGGIFFDDSDVYKVMEGAAYIYAANPDPELKKQMTELIATMAKAQEPDGYLYTARLLGSPQVRHNARWENLISSHELYNQGHMIEAAVAWYEASGRDDFLKIARKSADLMCRTFGYDKTQIKSTAGHQEIELALCKLYRVTGEKRYLDLAKFFLDVRGRRDLRSIWGSGLQDHLPVCEQEEAVGHAVRAAYMYCGMADVSALTGDESYLKAIDKLWENVVFRKLHLNGGIGARRHARHPKWGDAHEAFGVDFDLPNADAYLETCASIGNALWNERMFRRTGEAKYFDVIERIIYNGFLSGISICGTEFFYPNPLESKGGYKRSKWFGCSCCPVNVVRFIPQIPRMAFATRDDEVYVNLFVESDVKLKLKSGEVKLSQKTAYPWNGNVELTLNSVIPDFRLFIRIPGWCVGKPVPSTLYSQTIPASNDDFTVSVNGETVDFANERGYQVISRKWKAGDKIAIRMNMPVKRIKADDRVEADRGRLAVEKGPVLYCAEGFDNGGNVLNKVIAADAKFTMTKCEVLGHEYPAMTVNALEVHSDLSGSNLTVNPVELKLIPYFAWCHREPGNDMQTWFPVKPDAGYAAKDIKIKASFCHYEDTEKAVLDGRLPESSSDGRPPRLTFWAHRGTDEWVDFTFRTVQEVKGVEVYWFDDTGRGECRLPESWKVQWRGDDASEWREIKGVGEVDKDRFTKLDFPSSVKAKALRLKIKLQKDFSGGIHEVKIK